MNKHFTPQEIKQLKEIQSKTYDVFKKCNDLYNSANEENLEVVYIIAQSVIMTEILLNLFLNN